MTIKKRIITFLNNWKLSLLILIITGLCYYLGLLSENKFFVKFTEWTFFISIILTFISGVYALVRLQFLKGLGLIGIVVLMLFFVGSILMFYPNDFFADDLEIPENIKFKKLLGSLEVIDKTDSVQIYKKINLNFNLVNSFQPGIYDYYVWFKPNIKGNIFLKIFEITQNTPLSNERIESASRIRIKLGEDSLKLYQHHFTIYEGDWGKPYGARVELWFEPVNRKSFIVLQRNYIVEGWMR
jgi:hypothetical protein